MAIIGLGGTGSHILDLIAKTWVKEIHLYDGDILHLHNAFRMPGAPSRQELETGEWKVSLLAQRCSNLRSGVAPHQYPINETNVHEL